MRRKGYITFAELIKNPPKPGANRSLTCRYPPLPPCISRAAVSAVWAASHPSPRQAQQRTPAPSPFCSSALWYGGNGESSLVAGAMRGGEEERSCPLCYCRGAAMGEGSPTALELRSKTRQFLIQHVSSASRKSGEGRRLTYLPVREEQRSRRRGWGSRAALRYESWLRSSR